MKTIAISEVIISEKRQRKSFSVVPMMNQKTSIENGGLYHAITLRSETDNTLVAGERRLRNVGELAGDGIQIQHNDEQVPLGHIPYTILGDRSLIEYEEAELEENLQREDLTWQEETEAIDRLHKLRSEQAEAKGQVQTTLATAREINPGASSAEATTKVRDSAIIMKHMDNPEVASAKTRSEAIKVITKVAEKEKRERLAAAFDQTKSTHTLIHQDCIKAMESFAPGVFDCVITDPPYGMGADSFGTQTAGSHEYNDDLDSTITLLSQAIPLMTKCCKKDAHLYMFCDIRHFGIWKDVFAQYGWWVFHTPLIWSKGNGMLPQVDRGPRRTYEAVLFAIRGDKKCLKVANDVLDFRAVSRPQHAAEKPVELYTELLSRSCYPGDLILDPFAGSGTVFPAANKLKLIATGINLSEDDYTMAKLRLEENI